MGINSKKTVALLHTYSHPQLSQHILGFELWLLTICLYVPVFWIYFFPVDLLALSFSIYKFSKERSPFRSMDLLTFSHHLFSPFSCYWRQSLQEILTDSTHFGSSMGLLLDFIPQIPFSVSVPGISWDWLLCVSLKFTFPRTYSQILLLFYLYNSRAFSQPTLIYGL